MRVGGRARILTRQKILEDEKGHWQLVPQESSLFRRYTPQEDCPQNSIRRGGGHISKLCAIGELALRLEESRSGYAAGWSERKASKARERLLWKANIGRKQRQLKQCLDPRQNGHS
ncbi:hypothetical protein EVAR_21306_1 [Eumeta japonica]|uniref:Uncharacterized protein n=1 Tax=Eumeta variegata TaxID=151549 RepID=A0A4C1WPZ5_EUMVA|nr:hypothetical protein EVAR_21306_1 [Eumeta japonica]